ncbi:exportin-2 [Ischnura elegans]|uniref:exportin-2 n=1 Tax=Ischnura elegans TaxID=197161 RepID=UPI001ED88635|nr:exportin-2 [Ischnura elegans]XP_046386714.1 exportin-2 [Ischnura elegans]XP_046386715.1 exportin-2 [Ischnura elegans]
MELNDGNLQTLAGYLQQTLSPEINVRKPAEKFLESIEITQNFPLLLLHLVGKEDLPLNIRLSGAVAFKNFVKRNWEINKEEGEDRIHSSDREAIKALIVDLMLKSPESIQRQLSDAVSLIGRHDFPDKWPSLLPQMVEKFNAGDFHVINGVLRTAHSLFKRYRHEFKSQQLWTEIKLVLDTFARPLTDLFVATMNLTTVHANNVDALKVIYSSLTIICKVFYSLNFQDLPEFFEDNMSTWMTNFHTLLNTDIKELRTEEDEEVGPLEMLKSQVCDNVSLYAQKYDEEFQPFLPQMVTDVWNLLVTTGSQPKYDVLVSNALQFLVSVAERAHYSKLFEDPNVLSSICEKVIIPNVEFGTSDEELFGDNPEEYLRRDLEGSDVGTRRRSACNLVKALSTHFENQMMTVFGNYVQAMLSRYAENPESNWKCKDAALYIVTSLVVKGSTQKHGTTQISQLVNIEDFALQNIYPELEKTDVTSLPVIRADAIKYIITFRNQLQPQTVVGRALPRLVHLLTSPHRVVHSYAACAIDGILTLREAPQAGSNAVVPLVKGEVLQPMSRQLFSNLFAVFFFPGSEENEFAMKAIMRTFACLQEKSLPDMEEALPKLTNKLTAAAKNPSRPNFNHYLFEALALTISIACRASPAAVTTFETILFPIFQDILQQDVQEFIPYVFQLLSLLLELRPDGKDGKVVSEPYMALLPCLVAPVLWDNSGNVVPLARLLCAYVSRGGSHVCSSARLSGLLGVFQKLIASKMNDGEGFRLMSAILLHCPEQELSPFIRQVFVVLFQRLSYSKTIKFVKGLLVFFSLYIVKHGAGTFVDLIDEIQQRMFAMVVERLIVTDVQKISGRNNRKVVAVGLTKLLTECSQVIEGQYSNLWSPLLNSLVELFELPEDESEQSEELPLNITESDPSVGLGYQAAYSRLSFARCKEPDPLAHVSDPKLLLAESLGKLSMTHPGRLGPLIHSGLSPEGRGHLERYFVAANVTLA